MTSKASPYSVERRAMIPAAHPVAALGDLGGADDTLTAIRRLRCKVYCLEQKFVAMDDCPDALEGDEYDAHATHWAGEDPSGRVVATVRLVPHSPMGFPLEPHAGRLFPELRSIAPALTAECGPASSASWPRWSGGSGRLLQSHGIFFTPVGDPTDYYGEVVPYWRSLEPLRRGYEGLASGLAAGPTFRYVCVRGVAEAM